MTIRFETADWRDAAADQFPYTACPVVGEPVVLKHIGELNNEDKSVIGGKESANLPIEGHDSKKVGVSARQHATASVAARGAN